MDGGSGECRVVMPIRLKTRGGRTWLTRPDGQASSRRASIDRTLVRALASAHELARAIGVGSSSRSDLSKARGAGDSYKRGVVPLAFLDPTLQAAIVAGHQPAGLKLDHLLRMDIPLAWADQRAQLGF